MKKLLWTMLISGVILIPTTATQAQSAGRNPRIRSGSVSNVAVPGQAPESASPAEAQDDSQEKKVAIVGSWLGTSGEGNKLIQSYTADGVMQGSVQTEVSTIPELGVLTPAHGIWKHLGGRQYGVTAMSIIYDINTGALLGYLKARLVLTMNQAGDQMSGTDNVEIFAPDNTLLFAVTGSTTFTRIKFEPFN